MSKAIKYLDKLCVGGIIAPTNDSGILESFTKSDADKFIKVFNSYWYNKLNGILVGSIKTKGNSEHDIDIEVRVIDNDWFESLGEDESIQELVDASMTKLGARSISGGFVGSPLWDWHGLRIDILWPEGME